MPYEDIVLEADDKMEKAIRVMVDEFKGVRTGRATPAWWFCSSRWRRYGLCLAGGEKCGIRLSWTKRSSARAKYGRAGAVYRGCRTVTIPTRKTPGTMPFRCCG